MTLEHIDDERSARCRPAGTTDSHRISNGHSLRTMVEQHALRDVDYELNRIERSRDDVTIVEAEHLARCEPGARRQSVLTHERGRVDAISGADAPERVSLVDEVISNGTHEPIWRTVS